ncbi:MAG: glycosyltransferase [Lapillicoccus sp.]
MRDTGGAASPSAFLRAVVVGPAVGCALTVDLDRNLRDAGHDVTLLTVGATGAGSDSPGPAASSGWAGPPPPRRPGPAPRAVPELRRMRLDAWARVGRRVRGVDVIVLVHSADSIIPALLAFLHGAGAHGAPRHERRRPRIVVVAGASLSPPGRSATARLTRALLAGADAVVVHDEQTAAVAAALGADRVCRATAPVTRPGRREPVGGQPSAASASTPDSARPAGLHTSRTRVAIGAVAREVRHGLGRRSRVGSEGLVIRADRGPGRRPSARPEPSEWSARFDWSAPDGPSEPEAVLSADWAHYVGILESLASPLTSAEPEPEGWPGDEPSAPRATAVGAALVARLAAAAGRARAVLHAAGSPRAVLPLQRADLPDWVVPTDVLVDAADGDEAKRVARELGLPRVADGAEAWSALGALSAIIRVADDGHRSAVVVDESGPRSPLTRWARAVGFAPVSLGLGGPHADLAAVDLEMETLDVIARVHPGGCDVDDVDELVGSSSWLLRPGGLLVVTIPLGPPDAAGAIAPADVRGLVARAHGFGFALVGDLDGELTALMGTAATAATSSDTAYGLVRLTFRRQ